MTQDHLDNGASNEPKNPDPDPKTFVYIGVCFVFC